MTKAPLKPPGKPPIKITANAAANASNQAPQQVQPASQPSDEWLEVFPSGISVNSTVARPVLILKDKAQNEVLPVWMHPLDAGVALAEMSEASGLTPHSVTRKLLALLEMKLEACTFVELIGHHQYILLAFKSKVVKAGDGVNSLTESTHTLKVRADEAMSFCLQAKARFFATKSYMQRCRNLQAELGSLEQNLQNGALPQLQAEIEISSKKHPYMM
jgi:hypothetical protein